MIGRVAEDRLTHFRVFRVAVLRRPTGTGQQLGVADHVEQRHAADDRIQQIRPLGKDGPDEQTAVAAAGNAKVFWRSDSALGQIFTDGDEIVVGTLPLGLERGLVPARAELTAAANVRHRVRAAALEPKFANRRRVAGLE